MPNSIGFIKKIILCIFRNRFNSLLFCTNGLYCVRKMRILSRKGPRNRSPELTAICKSYRLSPRLSPFAESRRIWLLRRRTNGPSSPPAPRAAHAYSPL